MAIAVIIAAKQRRLVIDLSEAEASILKSVMQNPLWPEEEPQDLANVREAIFNALKNDGVE